MTIVTLLPVTVTHGHVHNGNGYGHEHYRDRDRYCFVDPYSSGKKYFTQVRVWRLLKLVGVGERKFLPDGPP